MTREEQLKHIRTEHEEWRFLLEKDEHVAADFWRDIEFLLEELERQKLEYKQRMNAAFGSMNSK